MQSAIDARVAGPLNQLFPGFEERLITKAFSNGASAVFLEVPPASGADYQFLLYFEPEMQIHARLLGTDQKRYFWYMPFEEAAYRNDMDKLCTAFVSTVEKVILCPTRIVQKKGLLLHTFTLESQAKANGEWQRVWGISCLRFAFEVPRIRGRRHVYKSPHLKSAINDD